MGTVPSASAEPVVRVRLLGQFAMTSGGRVASPWPRPSARRLCALAMVSPDRRVTRDLACDLLFPDLEPRAAARSLSKALSMARSALGQLGDPPSGLLATDLNHIWVSGTVEVDAEAHQEALRAGLAMRPGRDRDDQLSAALTEEAVLLADEPYADWALRPRERLEDLRQRARLALTRDRAMGAGRSGAGDVVMAWLAWLAWQDGHTEDVIRLAAEIAELGPGQHGFSAHLRWIYPVAADRRAAELGRGRRHRRGHRGGPPATRSRTATAP